MGTDVENPDNTSVDGRADRIGPWGATVRAAAGTAALAWALAVPHPHPWLDLPASSSRVWGVVTGVIVLPAVLTLAFLIRGRSAPPLRLRRVAAGVVTILTLVLLQFYPVAVAIAIAFPLLVQAVIRRAGCEVLTIPNLVLGRRDYLFCLPFTPIDQWERRRTGTNAGPRPAS